VNRIVHAPMQATQVLRLTAIGHFFNQVLPSGFAGDAARAWLAAREGCASVQPCVRSCGIASSACWCSSHGLHHALRRPTSPTRSRKEHLPTRRAARCGHARALFCWARRWPACEAPAHRVPRQAHPRSPRRSRRADGARRLCSRWRSSFNVAAMHWCAKGMRLDLDLALLVIVPAVMLGRWRDPSPAGCGKAP
jgi:hypothetical protein